MSLVSVVIPVYNKAQHIRRALDSVLSQTHEQLDVVVIDDGSTDGSSGLVDQYADSRLRLIRQENAGVSMARNRGIEEAKGELIAFLDADDQWLPEHLATVCRLAAAHPECGMCASSYRVVGADGKQASPVFEGIPEQPWEGLIRNFFRVALTSDPIWTSAVAVPRRVFAVCGVFPPGVKCGEDVDLWCRIALRYPIAFSTRATALYHKDAENRTSLEASVSCHPVVVQTLDGALESGSLPEGVGRDDVLEYRNKWLVGFATNCLLAGERRRAREYCARAASTRVFRWRRLRNTVASYLPSAFLRPLARRR